MIQHSLLPEGPDLAAMQREFRWVFPARMNMAEQVLDNWASANPNR